MITYHQLWQIVAGLLLLSLLSFCWGFGLRETVYVLVPSEVVKEVTVEHIKYITREVPVEIVKEVLVLNEPQELRFFETVEELEFWVSNNHTLFSIGISGENDCDDLAEKWQRKALAGGYLVSMCPVYKGKVMGTTVCNCDAHIGLWTFIGNDCWYWESTGEITKLGVVRD